MDTVFVKKIELISKGAEESLVYITDGTFSCITFCQPCNKSIGEIIKPPIYSFNTKNIVLASTSSQLYFQKVSNLGYEILAELYDKDKKIAKLGSILIELDENLPGGINKGDKIQFICERIDIE